MTFENGAVATVVNSLLSPRRTSYLRIDFAHATVELEHLYGYDDADWRVSPAPGHEKEIAKARAAGPTGRPIRHVAQLAAVFDALDRGVPPPVTAAEARLTLESVAALYTSAFTGRPGARGEIAPGSPFYSGWRGLERRGAADEHHDLAAQRVAGPATWLRPGRRRPGRRAAWRRGTAGPAGGGWAARSAPAAACAR